MENNNAPQNAGQQDAGTQVVSPDKAQGSSPQQGQNNTAGQSASAVQTPENLSFDKHPRFKQVIKENQTFRKELEDLRRQNQEFKGYVDGQRSNQQQGQQIAPEDEAQLEKLFSLAFSSPKVSKMLAEKLGVSNLDKLREQVDGLSTSWNGSQFNSEMREIKDYVKGLGLDPEEVQEELEQFVDEHPVYSQIGYKKGALQAAFRDKYWDKIGELRERGVNKKTLEEREALKRGQTQTTSDKNKPSAAGLSKDPAKRFGELVQQAGGMGNIDFSR